MKIDFFERDFIQQRRFRRTTWSQAFGRIAWWQQVLLIMLPAILYIHAAGYLGSLIDLPFGWVDDMHGLFDLVDPFTLERRFARWDSFYYLSIAQHGYTADMRSIAFFPLYPLLMRLINTISGIPFLWSGLLISTLAFIAAALLLYRLVALDYSARTAFYATLWVAIYPLAFFNLAVYTESLFLLLTILSIYLARKERFVWSGIAIALAGLTRPNAVILAVPFVLEFWLQGRFGRRELLKFGLGSLIAPLGMSGYLVFLARLGGSHNPLAGLALYDANQVDHFKRFIAWPWVTFYDGLKSALAGEGIAPGVVSRLNALWDLLFALLGLAAGFWGGLNLRLSYSAYFIAGLLFTFSSHGADGLAFTSISRYIGGMFPTYLILALISTRLPPLVRRLLLAASILSLGLWTLWFTTGHWVA